jgi:hypothetical protein
VSIDFFRYLRDVADFPRKGVVFKDLTQATISAA